MNHSIACVNIKERPPGRKWVHPLVSGLVPRGGFDQSSLCARAQEPRTIMTFSAASTSCTERAGAAAISLNPGPCC